MDGLTIRIAAAAVLTICGLFLGRAFAQSAGRRVQVIRRMREAVKKLGLLMFQDNLPLREALFGTRFSAFHRTAERLKVMGPGPAWLAARERLAARGAELDCLLDEDLAEIDPLFESLGQLDRAEQRLRIGAADAALFRQEGQAVARHQQVRKLYTTLGALIGLAVAIALL